MGQMLMRGDRRLVGGNGRWGRGQAMGSREPQQGLHPPEQLNSLFWTSATLRPRRLAGPEHCVKSPMVGRCLSHWESQARWQSQNRWLECRRLRGGGRGQGGSRPTWAPSPWPHSGSPFAHRAGGRAPGAPLSRGTAYTQSATRLSPNLGITCSSGKLPSSCPFPPSGLGGREEAPLWLECAQ